MQNTLFAHFASAVASSLGGGHSSHPASGPAMVPAGRAVSLSAARPMALRIAEGHAWVTLDDGTAGDVFLCPGQTLEVAAGRTAVLEPVGTGRVAYRFARRHAAAPATSWWRRASVGGAVSPYAGELCSA